MAFEQKIERCLVPGPGEDEEIKGQVPRIIRCVTSHQRGAWPASARVFKAFSTRSTAASVSAKVPLVSTT